MVSWLIAINANYPKDNFVEIASTQGNIVLVEFRLRKVLIFSFKTWKRTQCLIFCISLRCYLHLKLNKYIPVLATVTVSILIIVIFYYCIIDMEKMWQKPISIPNGLALLVVKFATAIVAVGKMVGCLLVTYTIRLVAWFDICICSPLSSSIFFSVHEKVIAGLYKLVHFLLPTL